MAPNTILQLQNRFIDEWLQDDTSGTTRELARILIWFQRRGAATVDEIDQIFDPKLEVNQVVVPKDQPDLLKPDEQVLRAIVETYLFLATWNDNLPWNSTQTLHELAEQ
jgi:hypothetical protein